MLDAIDRKFAALATDNAPGQEVRQVAADLSGKMIGQKFDGRLVDFSHGDVDAFLPAPNSFEAFEEGVRDGAKQAYTEYRGSRDIREVHPELVFLRLNGGTPLPPKKSEEGDTIRRELLMRAGYREVDRWLDEKRIGTGAKRDDILDACAVAIAARDPAGHLPDGTPQLDGHGLPMQIWF